MPSFSFFKILWQKKGFTLIEILTALVIFSGTAVILSGIRSGNLQRMEKIQNYQKATELLESKMTELEFEWSKKALHTIPAEDKGDFENEKHFSWSVKTQPLSFAESEKIFNLIAEQAGELAGIIQQLLNSAVLEVKLTIHFSKNTKKNSYSLSTYIVDYSKQPNIGMITQM